MNKYGFSYFSPLFTALTLNQTLAAVILLQLGYLGPECFSLSTRDLGMLFSRNLVQHSYWAAENFLEVYFYTFEELNDGDSVHRHLDQIWPPIQSFSSTVKPREEEETLWAKIAILQTFCEGALSVCSKKEQLHGEDNWSLPKIMPVLRILVKQAILRDESGEWSRSRGFIRQQLIELDEDVMADNACMNNDLCFRRYETLLRLWKMADANSDCVMVSSIQGKIGLLSRMQQRRTRGLGTSFVPYQVDARCAYPTAETIDPSQGYTSHFDSFDWPPPPHVRVRPDSASSSFSPYPPTQDQWAEPPRRGYNAFPRGRPRAYGQRSLSEAYAYDVPIERASQPSESVQ